MFDYTLFFEPTYIVLIGVGVLIATFASLVGIGGGLLWAPFYILVLGVKTHDAIILSFLVQVVGMGSATLENIRSKQIFWKLAFVLLPFIAVGVVIGSFLSQMIADSNYIEMGLGLAGIAVSLIFAFQSEHYDTTLTLDRSARPPLLLLPLSIVFGSVSGLFSIGIGDFLIPVIRGRMKVPMQFTVGTNLFLNFSIAAMGTVAHMVISGFRFDNQTMNIVLFSWIGVLVGGQIGPRLSNKISDGRLKEIFIFVLLLIGIHLVYHSL